MLLLLLLLLSRFSRVRLWATPGTAAYQAPPSMGFSRQEYWSGLPLPSPKILYTIESEVTQLCPTLCGPMDCSLPGSSVHRIFQAIVLEWIAISFSSGSSWPRDRTWVSRIVDRRFTIWATSGVPFPTLRHLPDPGVKPASLVSPALAGRFFIPSTTLQIP